jgi:hypothetical protein
VVEEVKKLRLESQILPFGQPEHLPNREVDVLLRRTDDAVAARVSEADGIAIT